MKVMRIFRAKVYPTKIQAFSDYMFSTVMARLRNQPGLISVHMGAPQPDQPALFVSVMVWESLDAVKAFAGNRWQEPVLHLDEAHYVDEVYVEHFDLIAQHG